jgi:RNA recognition motif-containing protein
MSVQPGQQSNSLFVGDISKFCTEENLESLFSAFGHIIDINIKRNNTTGKTLSYGFVTFSLEESAAKAMECLNGYVFFGRSLRLEHGNCI